MHEKRQPSKRLEDRADEALRFGNSAEAELYLDALIKKDPPPHVLHHAVLKKIALPLYEMAYGSTDPEIHEKANDIYGYVGQLLQQELIDFSSKYHREVGRISEYVFFALNLRAMITQETSSVVVPASGDLDKAGIDFHQTPVGTKSVSDGLSYQVKTQATEEDQDAFASRPTILISLADIDPYASTPHHPDSLARTILRELHMPLPDEVQDIDHLYSHTDSERLNRASEWIETKARLKQGASVRRMRQRRKLSYASIRHMARGEQQAA